MKSQSLDTQSRSGLDGAALEKFVTMLPLESYMAGEAILIAGSKTGRLLFLKSGAVVILKNSVEIATVREPGAVLGEISALLDRPHTAGVRALESSEFYIADASLRKIQLRHFTSLEFWLGVWSRPTRVLSS